MERRNLKLSSSKPGSRKAACWKQSWGEEITYKYTNTNAQNEIILQWFLLNWRLRKGFKQSMPALGCGGWAETLFEDCSLEEMWAKMCRSGFNISLFISSDSLTNFKQMIWYSPKCVNWPLPGPKAGPKSWEYGWTAKDLESEKERRIPIIGLHQCEALT